MKMPDNAEISAALDRVLDPLSERPLGQSGRISGLVSRDGGIGLVLAIDGLAPPVARALQKKVETALSALAGVTSVRVITTAERGPEAARAGRGGDPHPTQPAPLPNIAAIIAVASGKGGVGKSTVAANLAVALARRGLAVGLLDADIYGPSVPTLLGCKARVALKDNLIQPLVAHGISAVSMGAMANPDQAVVWRGPMASSAMMQMVSQTDWGRLDILVVDLPPGTGDIQLTMAQKLPVTGAVIVSTPQDLALIDARKAIAMFGRVDVPVIGIVENMSSFRCPACGHEAHVFGHGGARETAHQLGVPFLGDIPLDMAIRAKSDAGTPVALGEGGDAAAFATIAERTLQALEEKLHAA
jgi:ATP-binding protein involved in chromosome partitioning